MAKARKIIPQRCLGLKTAKRGKCEGMLPFQAYQAEALWQLMPAHGKEIDKEILALYRMRMRYTSAVTSIVSNIRN